MGPLVLNPVKAGTFGICHILWHSFWYCTQVFYHTLVNIFTYYMYSPPTVGEPARERHPAYIRGRRDRSPHDSGAPRSPCGPRVHALPAGALGRACHRNLPRILPRHGKINAYSEITW